MLRIDTAPFDKWEYKRSLKESSSQFEHQAQAAFRVTCRVDEIENNLVVASRGESRDEVLVFELHGISFLVDVTVIDHFGVQEHSVKFCLQIHFLKCNVGLCCTGLYLNSAYCYDVVVGVTGWEGVHCEAFYSPTASSTNGKWPWDRRNFRWLGRHNQEGIGWVR